MGNPQNIIPNSERTPEERKAIARAGGIASGEARRRKRAWRECAEIIGEWDIAMPLPGGVTKEMTYNMAAILKQYQKAITKGDTNAAKFIAKLLGEYTEKHEVEAKGAVIFLPKDEIEGIQELAKR
jgi:hypothetical protein